MKGGESPRKSEKLDGFCAHRSSDYLGSCRSMEREGGGSDPRFGEAMEQMGPARWNQRLRRK